MRLLTDGLLGVIPWRNYRLEVWRLETPKRAVSCEPWIYITKINHGGEIGHHSIGLPASDLPELTKLLARLTEGSMDAQENTTSNKPG